MLAFLAEKQVAAVTVETNHVDGLGQTVRLEDNFCPNKEDTIRVNVYMDAVLNKGRHKQPLSCGMKFLSEWAVSDRNLPIDMFTRHSCILIRLLLQLFVCM